MESAGAVRSSTEAEDFVRFCYRRRRVGWPELYDEMCLVATRGAFRGMGHGDLAEVGIGFSLFDTRSLAALVNRVVAEEQAERARMRAARIVRIDDTEGAPSQSAVEPAAAGESTPGPEPSPTRSLAAVPAGA